MLLRHTLLLRKPGGAPPSPLHIQSTQQNPHLTSSLCNQQQKRDVRISAPTRVREGRYFTCSGSPGTSKDSRAVVHRMTAKNKQPPLSVTGAALHKGARPRTSQGCCFCSWEPLSLTPGSPSESEGAESGDDGWPSSRPAALLNDWPAGSLWQDTDLTTPALKQQMDLATVATLPQDTPVLSWDTTTTSPVTSSSQEFLSAENYSALIRGLLCNCLIWLARTFTNAQEKEPLRNTARGCMRSGEQTGGTGAG